MNRRGSYISFICLLTILIPTLNGCGNSLLGGDNTKQPIVSAIPTSVNIYTPSRTINTNASQEISQNSLSIGHYIVETKNYIYCSHNGSIDRIVKNTNNSQLFIKTKFNILSMIVDQNDNLYYLVGDDVSSSNKQLYRHEKAGDTLLSNNIEDLVSSYKNCLYFLTNTKSLCEYDLEKSKSITLDINYNFNISIEAVLNNNEYIYFTNDRDTALFLFNCTDNSVSIVPNSESNCVYSYTDDHQYLIEEFLTNDINSTEIVARDCEYKEMFNCTVENGNLPENIILRNSKLYILYYNNNDSGLNISVIDINTNKPISRIRVYCPLESSGYQCRVKYRDDKWYIYCHSSNSTKEYDSQDPKQFYEEIPNFFIYDFTSDNLVKKWQRNPLKYNIDGVYPDFEFSNQKIWFYKICSLGKQTYVYWFDVYNR